MRERQRQTATKPRYYIRGIEITAISGLDRIGVRGCPRQRLRQQNPSRPPGPRSCQLARCPRTPPRPFRRPLCPSWRAGFAPIPTKSGASKASGWILGSWERRRPGPASAASRSLQKIVGAFVGAASRAGREHLQGSSPPDSTESRIQGDLDVRVPRRSARARASVRRWPWLSRRGRQRGKGVGACHLVSQRRCKVQCRATGRPMNGSPTIGERH